MKTLLIELALFVVVVGFLAACSGGSSSATTAKLPAKFFDTEEKWQMYLIAKAPDGKCYEFFKSGTIDSSPVLIGEVDCGLLSK